ncbi:MAG: TlpA family protein disulfide reductase [Mycobacteriales bacterium]|nr:TlpA family protein disulfide reductase [Frankia sp.]
MRRTAIVAALLAVATGCTGGSRTPVTDASRSAPPLPMIATDPCPSADQLLPADARPAGERLPDLTLPCLGVAGSVPLRALGRVPTVVNLWASWCAPCRDEMPAFQRIYAAAHGRVRFLGVNTRDTQHDALAAIQHTGINYPSVYDARGRLRAALAAVAMPTTLIVSATGVVVFRQYGPVTPADLTAALADRAGVRL